jgi:inner membrane protein
VLAAAPDLDVIGFRYAIAYGDLLGHRGLTHSIPFAAAVAAVVELAGFRYGTPGLRPRALWLFLFFAIASHGLLDALTDGGLGVALFAPIETTRYFFPFQPIRVSPIGVRQFFSERGVEVVGSELAWVWLPSMLAGILALVWKRARRSSPAAA